jgi:small subunit ribosomal protein S27e
VNFLFQTFINTSKFFFSNKNRCEAKNKFQSRVFVSINKNLIKIFGGTTMKNNPDSKFLKLRCEKCKNEQIVFGKVASAVECLVCGEPLSASTGGKTGVKSRVLEVLE